MVSKRIKSVLGQGGDVTDQANINTQTANDAHLLFQDIALDFLNLPDQSERGISHV